MKFIITLLAIVLLFPALGFSADYSFSKQTIKVEQEKEYLKVIVTYDQKKEPIVYRVYPCGKVDRQDWKEISPNKEDMAGYYFNPSNISITLPTTGAIYDNGTGSLTADAIANTTIWR